VNRARLTDSVHAHAPEVFLTAPTGIALLIGYSMRQPPDFAPPRLILVGGGARSGKSAFALAYARRLGGRRLFLATAEALDEDMRERIGRHQAERGFDWETREEPLALCEALAAVSRETLVLVDCLTLWLSNLLLRDLAAGEILARVDRLCELARARAAPTLVVTNEVGMGLVPETPLGRAFRDLSGLAHQRLARAADQTFASMVGVVVRLHPGPLQTFRAGETP
jgi:adenosylcobinamide kinase / adenosylcobinamide-phosphate guanylyltransferase